MPWPPPPEEPVNPGRRAAPSAPRPRGKFASLRLAAALLAALAAGPAVRAADPTELLDAVRSTTLDPERAVALRNVELEVGIATLNLERGVLVPTRPVDGRTVEMVFIGQARFRCTPPDEIEAGQIELFTGRRSLDAPLEQAVLVIANHEQVADLLDRYPPLELRPAVLERAEQFHRDWLGKPERRNTGVESAIFRSLVGDAAFRGYFAVWARSHELGDFVYQLDPEDIEQLTVASFVPLQVKGWDLVRLRREIRSQQRKGRWLGVRLEDLGAWDIWLSAPWSPNSDGPLPGSVGFEAEQYTLDVTVQRRSLRLQGRARLRLTALSSGRLAVPLDLYRDLEVRRATDGRGRELFHFRSGPEVVVLLAEPSRAGEELLLDIEYGGHALRWVARGTYDLEDTGTWYPHCGHVDRARYDVTLNWPKKYVLLASGKRVAEGRRLKYRWERRVLDVPSIAFSFVMGDFSVDRRRSGDTDLVVAFNRHTAWRQTARERERVLETLDRSLRFLEGLFGPYPLQQLHVATLPRDYSQSYSGFMTLTDSVVRPDPPRSENEMTWFRSSTIAHEMAHQWWGNLVGWWSYRDQWLSEAMANYAALLYYAAEEGRGDGSLADLSAGWKETLVQTTAEGRTFESLGPVVLGARLNSSVASNGYSAVVYRKGAVVLAMLARAMGEERFLEMLRALLDAAAHRVISTEDFLNAMEHMSATDLEPFARQFIYGTGIPRIYYDYEVERGEIGGWVLRGEASRFEVPRRELRLTRSEAGRWDLGREFLPGREASAAGLMVPFQVAVKNGAAPAEAGQAGGQDGQTALRAGRIFLNGPRDDFEITFEREPSELRLDPRDEVLAYFHSAKQDPRRVGRYAALDLVAEGRLDEAEASYLRALEQPVDPADPSESLSLFRNPDAEAARETARIRLDLARLYLDRGRLDEAGHQLDVVEDGFGSDWASYRVEREALRGRLEIARGEYEPAFRRLKRILRMASPRGTDWRSMLTRAQLGSEWEAMTEAYALLAAAAYETGDLDDARWALREARDRGVVMDELSDLL